MLEQVLKDSLVNLDIDNTLEVRRILFLCSANKILRKHKICKKISLGEYPKQSDLKDFITYALNL